MNDFLDSREASKHPPRKSALIMSPDTQAMQIRDHHTQRIISHRGIVEIEKASVMLWQENSGTECPKTEKALAGPWQGFCMKTEKTLAGKLGHSVPDSREGFDRAFAAKLRRPWHD